MNADFPVVIDACVLVNYAVADLLSRLAEPPPGLPATLERRNIKGVHSYAAHILLLLQLIAFLIFVTNVTFVP